MKRGNVAVVEQKAGGFKRHEHDRQVVAGTATMKRSTSKKVKHTSALSDQVLEKCLTGIQGLDEITFGGLPKSRPTLLCGSAGCGKTLFAMEFIVRGAVEYNEPGVYMSFEENSEELTRNFASLGFDLQGLVDRKKLVMDYVFIERSEIEETGEYDLDGLFVRLGHAIDSIHAKRVALDTIEALFSGLGNENILRSELRRLFRWLKSKGVTAVVTAERGDSTLTRYGLEEYVADCVILLDHRVNDQIATRRLKIIKYRGSRHGTNEFPFLVNDHGISVLPITSLGLNYSVTNERISTGIKTLDAMFDEKGFYKGSTILVSGPAGTGKTSFASHFADQACRKGKRCIMFSFEESQQQLIRNMQNIGINLQAWVDKGVLRFSANRPSLYGLEMHLVNMHGLIKTFKPDIVVIDPITNLIATGTLIDTKSMLTRLLDFLKMEGITLFITDLSSSLQDIDQTEIGISSLVDTWIRLENVQRNQQRDRFLTIIKSRGMRHSNFVKEFMISNKGIQLKTEGGEEL